MSGEPTLDKGNSGFFQGTLHAWRNGRLSRLQYAVTMLILVAITAPTAFLVGWLGLAISLAGEETFLPHFFLGLLVLFILALLILAAVARRLRDSGFPGLGGTLSILFVYVLINTLLPVLLETIFIRPFDVSGIPELALLLIFMLLVVVPTDWTKPRPPKGF